MPPVTFANTNGNNNRDDSAKLRVYEFPRERNPKKFYFRGRNRRFTSYVSLCSRVSPIYPRRRYRYLRQRISRVTETPRHLRSSDFIQNVQFQTTAIVSSRAAVAGA